MIRRRHTLYNQYMYPLPHHFPQSDSDLELVTVRAMTVTSLLTLGLLAIPFSHNLTSFIAFSANCALNFLIKQTVRRVVLQVRLPAHLSCLPSSTYLVPFLHFYISP